MNTKMLLKSNIIARQNEMHAHTSHCRSIVVRKTLTSILAALLMVMFLVASCSPSMGATEYEVKAAFIYNFAKFVEWTSGTFENTNSPIIIGVLGSDGISDALDQTVSNKRANGRKLSVKRVSRIRDLNGCNIVFVGRSEKRNIDEIIKAVKGSNVLTIGETEGFARRGGTINFVMNDRKVGFEINIDAAKRESIKINSQLLSLARIVKDK